MKNKKPEDSGGETSIHEEEETSNTRGKEKTKSKKQTIEESASDDEATVTEKSDNRGKKKKKKKRDGEKKQDDKVSSDSERNKAAMKMKLIYPSTLVVSSTMVAQFVREATNMKGAEDEVNNFLCSKEHPCLPPILMQFETPTPTLPYQLTTEGTITTHDPYIRTGVLVSQLSPRMRSSSEQAEGNKRSYPDEGFLDTTNQDPPSKNLLFPTSFSTLNDSKIQTYDNIKWQAEAWPDQHVEDIRIPIAGSMDNSRSCLKRQIGVQNIDYNNNKNIIAQKHLKMYDDNTRRVSGETTQEIENVFNHKRLHTTHVGYAVNKMEQENSNSNG